MTAKACPRGEHFVEFHGCMPNKMKLSSFLKETSVEPIEIHYDIEMSWYNYLRGHPRKKDIGKAYDTWFKENEDWIEPIAAEVAKRDYKVEIVK